MKPALLRTCLPVMAVVASLAWTGCYTLLMSDDERYDDREDPIVIYVPVPGPVPPPPPPPAPDALSTRAVAAPGSTSGSDRSSSGADSDRSTDCARHSTEKGDRQDTGR